MKLKKDLLKDVERLTAELEVARADALNLRCQLHDETTKIQKRLVEVTRQNRELVRLHNQSMNEELKRQADGIAAKEIESLQKEIRRLNARLDRERQ